MKTTQKGGLISNRQFIELTRPNINRPIKDLVDTLIIFEAPYDGPAHERPIGTHHEILQMKCDEIMTEIALRN